MQSSNDTEVHHALEVLMGSAVQLQTAIRRCIRLHAQASATLTPPLESLDLRRMLGLLRLLMARAHPARSDVLHRFEIWLNEVDSASVQRDFLLIRARRGVQLGPSLFELTRATAQLERHTAQVTWWEDALAPPSGTATVTG